ncbi:outer membrane beta-barrel family protein [Sinomicrobium weinanense]|uniref:TonB-dependent receptor n=1 Tax=Sinomicrobium weinanense TaxID=2842200 RepID=A0A926JS95_9FLAO|nr:outer membrane beta-barrel family protein [Sinomicrobium weinanense]MBC9796565.1 TonB-dependent receptor [Sinomicrobium weinanense]MBU3123048.1 TonB-dependent receptor [Sinomicrobium weinanense]
MKKTLLLLSIFLLQYSFAQQSGSDSVTLTGTVVDSETNDPLEFATLVVRSLDNPEKVSGGLTDAEGKFNVTISAGNYDVSVEFMSYKSYTLKNQSLTGSKNLGTIPLSLDIAQLDEVEVVGQRTTVELRLDKKIYNVGQDLTTKGGSVSDVLDNVPSVSVDVEGNVSLRGNDNVRILINGRPSGLVGLNSADALRQLPSDAIEKVEVITSPSARYDAEGTGGILNIILKKGKADGFNGSVTVNTGIPDNHGVSTNLNYRTGKFNFFTNGGYSYRDAPGNSYNFTEYKGNVDNRFLEETRDRNRKSNNLNANVGAEYNINDKHSIVGSVLIRDQNGDNTTKNYTDKFDDNRNLTNQVFRYTGEDEKDKTLEFNLNYLGKFNDEGHELSVALQHSDDEEDERSNIYDQPVYPDEGPRTYEKLRTFEKQKNILVQADYVLPLGEESQFEAGFKSNLNDMSNDYTVENQDDEGNFYVNDSLTNLFNYDEHIHAFYAQYGTKFDKFSVLLGLRTEITNIDISVEGFDLDAKKNYTKVFPTVNLGYELRENESITLGYNRRIRRPWSRFLNPFPSRESKTNVFQGNADLNPSYSDAFDLGYLRQWTNLTFNASVYYQYATDVFQFISEPTGNVTDEGDPIIKRGPINLATDSRFGFELALMYSPFQWWRINTDFNFFRSSLRGSYNDVSYDADNTSWFTRLNSKVNLPGKIDFQTILFYRGPYSNSQNEYKGMLSTNLAFSKDILNDNATVSLNVSDLFNSRKRKMETITDSFETESEFQWRERQFTLSFTYRFNQSKRQRDRQERNGDEDMGGFEG